MRTLILSTAGIIAAVTLTACGTAASHNPEPTRTNGLQVTDPESRFSADERAYLDALEVVYPDLVSAPMVRREAVRMGHSTCRTLDRGVTIDQMVDAYSTSNVDQEMAAGIMLAAIHELCPEYRDDLDAAIDGGVSS